MSIAAPSGIQALLFVLGAMVLQFFFSGAGHERRHVLVERARAAARDLESGIVNLIEEYAHLIRIGELPLSPRHPFFPDDTTRLVDRVSVVVRLRDRLAVARRVLGFLSGLGLPVGGAAIAVAFLGVIQGKTAVQAPLEVALLVIAGVFMASWYSAIAWIESILERTKELGL